MELSQKQRHVFLYHKGIQDYLENFEILNIEVLPSVWRSDNTVLKIETDAGPFVFKHIFDISEILELEQHRKLKASYKGFTPRLFVVDGQAFLMEYVEGEDFFSLIRKMPAERVAEKMKIAGSYLAKVYSSVKEKRKSSGLEAVGYTASHYLAKCLKKGSISPSDAKSLEEFLQLWAPVMSSYEGQTAHCDLNCANLIISDSKARAIDPEFDYCNSQDIARDLGRYSASIFLNNFDYNGQNLEESAMILGSFLSSFAEKYPQDPELAKRAMFYHAQSALSFSNFNTKSVDPKMYSEYSVILFGLPPPKSFGELALQLSESFKDVSGNYLR